MMSKVRAVFKAYPVLANSTSYGILYGTAELSQQMVTRKLSGKTPWEAVDKDSVIRFIIVGSCVNSNLLYFWYKWLDKAFVGTAWRTVGKKLLLGQLVFTPVLLSSFYISMSILEGHSDVLAEVKQKLLKTWQTSFCFWLPAQTINFLFVPPAARVVFVGMGAVIWVNILCFIKRSKTIGLPELET